MISSPSTRRSSRTGAVLVLALLAAACGGQPPVQLDVAPAGAEDAPPPAEATPPAEEATPADTADETGDPAPDEVAEAQDATEDEPVPAGTSARPSPLPADPELVVGEDGCVTDVATGLVVTCHDPAEGPDPE